MIIKIKLVFIYEFSMLDTVSQLYDTLRVMENHTGLISCDRKSELQNRITLKHIYKLINYKIRTN